MRAKIIVLFLFVITLNINGQDVRPQVFYANSEKILIVYQNPQNQDLFSARFINDTGDAVSEEFESFSNEAIYLSNNGEIFSTKSKLVTYPDPIRPPSTEYYGRVRDTSGMISEPVLLYSSGGLECGTGFLGFEEIIQKTRNDNYLYITQYNSNLNFHLTDSDISKEYTFESYFPGKMKISSVVDSADNIYLSSFCPEPTFTDNDSIGYFIVVEKLDTLTGNARFIYWKLIKNNMDLLVNFNYETHWIPQTKLFKLPDETVQLFIVDPLTLSLSVINNVLNTGEMTEEIIQFEVKDTNAIYSIDAFNISNISKDKYSLFISLKPESGKINNFICTFNSDGSLEKIISNYEKLFTGRNDFSVKVGEEKYINVERISGKDYVSFYENFTLLDRISIADYAVSVEHENKGMSYALQQNYPNPFNPTTTIKYSVGQINNLTFDKQKNNLSNANHVTLKVYNTLGQEVATLVDQQQSPGNYEVKFDGTKLSSGVYFYRLEMGGFVKTQKMMLVK